MTFVAPSLSLPEIATGENLSKELSSISFPYANLLRSRRSFLRAAWTLQRQGIIRLSQVAGAADIEALNIRINQVLDQVESYRASGIAEHPISDAYLNVPENRAISGYKQLVNADRSVINLRFARPDGRSGSDAGMVDIFHPEKLSSELNQLTSSVLQAEVIQNLLWTSCLSPVKIKCRNLYINNGVEDTRGFHCDGRALKFKAFLFLSDVRDLGEGPYCYVKGSHHDGAPWLRTSAFNQANGIDICEFTQLGGSEALPMMARAGDMVISSQAGAHRGHPQHPEGKRRVLVAMYSPRSKTKLSRLDRLKRSARRWITSW